MKSLFCLSLAFLFFTGCSSTFRISDFSSHEKFYDNFNNFVKNKSVKIILDNDSSIISSEGAYISNDSLVFITQEQKVMDIDKSNIKDIKYSGNDMTNLTAVILLKNGDKISAKNTSLTSDSSIRITVFANKNGYIPISRLKKITYKNGLLGFGSGFLIGIPVGIICAYSSALLSGDINAKDQSNLDSDYKTGLIAGPIVVGILGAILGYNYNYIFTP